MRWRPGSDEGIVMAQFLLFLFYIVLAIQGFFAYGTAYRLTKKGGNNGVSLFGWMIVMELAAIIPGLGIYLWRKYKDIN